MVCASACECGISCTFDGSTINIVFDLGKALSTLICSVKLLQNIPNGHCVDGTTLGDHSITMDTNNQPYESEGF